MLIRAVYTFFLSRNNNGRRVYFTSNNNRTFFTVHYYYSNNVVFFFTRLDDETLAKTATKLLEYVSLLDWPITGSRCRRKKNRLQVIISRPENTVGEFNGLCATNRHPRRAVTTIGLKDSRIVSGVLVQCRICLHGKITGWQEKYFCRNPSIGSHLIVMRKRERTKDNKNNT